MMVAEEECGSARAPPSPKGLKAAVPSGEAAAGVVGPTRYQVDHRALLFGSRFGRSDKVNSKGLRDAKLYAAVERTAMEEHNEDLTEQLHNNVVELKEVTLGIKQEVSKSQTVLEDMSGAFDRAGQLLARATGQLKHVAQNPSSRHMCWMVAFIVALLMALYSFIFLFRGRSLRSIAGRPAGVFLAQ
ncbi:unnamed protein product [Polarella glacialis]|uniref:t-SNARE coiled-coil homology domain-containing protein n=1 Tax=Polarella glacialis TaxID=89957 RepID=A0A813DPG0_POLGL|nr:unnamed protein product [Polarella glacialis]CAE8737364.1 unnamed protein product [Polarella glacialis]|mmetsp:Transcript_63077/g.102190  ORF Transcript_63077/g.102190 Transcript_63077/m.102190 type:complete len:187 (-) Transcript_63077:142-702(-)